MRRSQDDGRKRAALARDRERRRSGLDRPAELVVAFRPFASGNTSRSTEASVFLAAAHLYRSPRWRFQQEYTLWAARFRSVRAEARRTISPRIGECEPELVPDL